MSRSPILSTVQLPTVPIVYWEGPREARWDISIANSAKVESRAVGEAVEGGIQSTVSENGHWRDFKSNVEMCSAPHVSKNW